MSETKHSYEEIAAAVAKKYKRDMRIALVVAGVSATLALVIAYLLLTRHFSEFFSALLVIALVTFMVAILFAVIDAHYYAAKKYYEPQLWKKEGEYQKLREAFGEYVDKSREHVDYLFGEYFYLASFIISRSPELLAEFAAWREDQSQSLSAEGKKKGEN